ncbi:nitrilase [Pseudomonas sp. RIT-PI-q]|uniref:carbon-nitrogen hydrolase family protein n=1 Tax=Pseudomonas sp. RIT-PI-q TaxID=1690247 RepID=UPI0006CDC53C|nr:carbon-nitrogen hydrolase family protein [Pseudomonas sp. RIT-PI-q]KPG95957.1 nitrilase [Pseudomonas sp. RIT-PI-q]
MIRVAVVQAASILFNPLATTEKACEILKRVSLQGGKLAVFPEAFIGGYPKGQSFGNLIGNRSASGKELYKVYFDGAIKLDGQEMQALIEAVNDTQVTTVMGIIEQLGRTLYCTAVTLVPGIGIAGYRRKLMPTGLERTVWGFGDGSTLNAVPTEHGILGTVICWENYMPALRHTMYAQGVQIYCAPTADDRPSWPSSMVHIAIEGRVFVLSACQAIKVSDFPEEFQSQLQLDARGDDYLMHGGSMIVSPNGELLAPPVYDCETEIYADLDLSDLVRGQMDFDVAGHYSRPDVFQLHVNTDALKAVNFTKN